MEEERSNLGDRIVRINDSVSLDGGVRVDFKVVTTRHSLISKEVDLRELGNVLQAVGLVPALGENINANLASNGELEVELISKLLVHSLNHSLANLVDDIIVEELNALLLIAVTADGANVQHTSTELDEISSVMHQRDTKCQLKVQRSLKVVQRASKPKKMRESNNQFVPLLGDVKISKVVQSPVNELLQALFSKLVLEALG